MTDLKVSCLNAFVRILRISTFTFGALTLGASTSTALAQVTDDGAIITEPLDPPEQGILPGSKLAPFKTPAIPRQPVLIDPVGTVPYAGANIRQLDKMTGRIQSFEIAAGAETQFDRLRVRLEACRAPEDNSQHGSMAFVQIWDTKLVDSEPVFSGWMFAESPALSALDHPRYDLWVISCTTSPGEAPVPSE